MGGRAPRGSLPARAAPAERVSCPGARASLSWWTWSPLLRQHRRVEVLQRRNQLSYRSSRFLQGRGLLLGQIHAKDLLDASSADARGQSQIEVADAIAA